MTNLTRWEPLRDRVSLRQAMDRLFDESFVRPFGWDGEMLGGSQSVPLDVMERKDEVVVKASLPGIKAENIRIDVTGDGLSIKGEFEEETEVKDADYVRRERRCGSFGRSVALPTTVVADRAKAEFENGVLTLILPKADEVKPKTITVRAKK